LLLLITTFAKQRRMNDLWLEMHIPVPAEGEELLCNELAELGCAGVTVAERLLDTFEPPVYEQEPGTILLLKAFFPPGEDSEDLRRRIQERLVWLTNLIPGLSPELPHVQRVRQDDWAENWKQHFPPLQIGDRLLIRPSWEQHTPMPGQAVIELDPGMAFGTGTHATTRLCLEALAAEYPASAAPARVLDVGTGSGILAMAAAALGAVQVLACDIDNEACRAAADNVRRNGLAERVTITDTPLGELAGEFDVVLANILAEENIRLAAQLVQHLAAGGVLILSGILQEKEAAVVGAFAAWPLGGPQISRLEEWSCLVYRR
jgi:ribosomal protein L11 methyltransferase